METNTLHGNTGRKPSEETRHKLSEAKKGVKHPKHKGTYITPWGSYTTAREAAAGSPVAIPFKTVHNRCLSWRFTHLGYVFKPA